MERVQYQLERSIPQLQLLDENGIFSKAQLRSITTQRQLFEGRLTRRGPEKEDFTRYSEFEQNLADLINTKAQRLGLPRTFFQSNSASHTGHIISIYERMVRKFKYDVDAWFQYIGYAKSKKMRVVTGRVYARALSLHANSVPLWLSAASHELNDNSSTAAARSLLQRALRLNNLPWKPTTSLAGPNGSHKRSLEDAAADSQKRLRTDESEAVAAEPPRQASSGPARLKLSRRETDLVRLWVEYIRMELVFIERLRRRWLVLGLEWDDDDVGTDSKANAGESNETQEAQQAAIDVDADVQGRQQGETADDERALLAQVPEREQDAPPADSTEVATESKPNTFAPRKMASIPPSQIAILRGSIPLYLISSGLDTLPPALHFLFLLALLEMLRNFPFAEPIKIDGRRSGESLQLRLLDAVYSALSDQPRWSWTHFAPAALVAGVRSLREPSYDLLSDEEKAQVHIANTEEMEHHKRLLRASELRASFSEDTDGLLNLAEYLRSTPAKHVSSADLAVRLVLELAESSLVDRSRGEARPSLHCQRLAQAGRLPRAVRDSLTVLRPLCKDAPAAASSTSAVARKVGPKSELYTITSLLLELLADQKRSGIDEPNLVRYLRATELQLIQEARAAGPGVETAQMRAVSLRRKVDRALSEDTDIAALQELEDELKKATSRSEFPASDELWSLRIRVKGRLLEADGNSDTGALIPEWKRGLTACSESIGQDTDIDFVSIETSLWGEYLSWLHERVVVRFGGDHLDTDSRQARRKKAKSAYKHNIENYRWAVRETYSLLSRAASGPRLDAIHAWRQSMHDLSVLRYFSDSQANGKAQDAAAWLLTSSHASLSIWVQILAGLKLQSKTRGDGDDEDGDDAEPAKTSKKAEKYAAVVNQIFNRLLQQKQGSEDGTVVELWVAYLEHLASVDMPKALVELQNSKKALSEYDARQVEKSWQLICQRLQEPDQRRGSPILESE
ncbi:hypothetical protein BCV70DRAFT_197945 [Testicularia cyperi]|uniref:U3 small nucleolar RNA-associated protein 6 N-terminal domain-containing protein n=1 Tax=Testicularia cyperi TaxID=1882483 RepID=A0A317Y0M9_9BASI|nr:hypothetical protein BCV70DRAFT_197945 [Testicularia cyperi]